MSNVDQIKITGKLITIDPSKMKAGKVYHFKDYAARKDKNGVITVFETTKVEKVR